LRFIFTCFMSGRPQVVSDHFKVAVAREKDAKGYGDIRALLKLT